MRLRPHLLDLTRVALLLALVYLAGASSVLFRPEGSDVATWWPAAGVSVALLMLSPRRWWPWLFGGIVVASVLANLTGGRGSAISALFGLSNASEALVVATILVPARGGRFELDTPAAFFRLVRACVAGAFVLGVGVALAVGSTGRDGLGAATTAAPSHLAATLVMLPLLLLPSQAGQTRGRRLELVVQSALLVATSLLVFWPSHALALTFLPLPLLLWASLRLGSVVVSTQLMVLAVVATGMTANGGGPFAIGARSSAVDATLAGAQVQIFLICAALLALPSALAGNQLKALLGRLTSERELAAITLATTEAIILVTDAHGTVLRANPTTARMTGFPVSEYVGHLIWETGMVPPERLEIVRALFANADGSSIPGSREADVMRSDGERLRVVWNNNVVLDPSGALLHAVFTGVDVTAERTTSGMVQHLLEAPVATAVVGTDQLGRVTLFNRGAQEMLGRSVEETMGQPLHQIVVSPQPARFVAGSADTETGDWSWTRADGTVLTISTTISVVRNGAGKPVGYLCVGRDVTEQRATQEMLVAALEKEREGMERLRRLDAAKNDFVSTASHELRTPTTSIVGYTEMLREGLAGEPTPEQIRMLDAIARNGARLLTVASDLLTLSELESDTSEWQHAPVDLASLLGHIEEAVRPLMSGRDLVLRIEPPTSEVIVSGDAAHLDRVLMNLLSNAIKFTADGGSVHCAVEADATHALLVVSDDGIGIPVTEQQDLFTKFFRSSTAQERAIQGTGLGLSIVSSIVEAHDGTIDVRSAHLKGTTFTVRLPLARVPAASTAPPPG
ncbi:MAG: ATP-binding protein [Marmoricola sp.]